MSETEQGQVLSAARMYAAPEMVHLHHTPGRWQSDNKVRPWQGGISPGCMVHFWRGHTGSPIANCWSRDVGNDEAIANAQLVSAAPEMLVALKMVLDAIDNNKPIDREVVHMAVASAELIHRDFLAR